MNVNKLRGKIVERGMSVETLATAIRIHPSSLYRKMNNAEKITIGEVAKIKEALDISNEDAMDIFLS